VVTSSFFSSKYGEYLFLISKFPLLDLPALFFCRQVTKIRHKKKTLAQRPIRVQSTTTPQPALEKAWKRREIRLK
jgi:hypothetical protein